MGVWPIGIVVSAISEDSIRAHYMECDRCISGNPANCYFCV